MAMNVADCAGPPLTWAISVDGQYAASMELWSVDGPKPRYRVFCSLQGVAHATADPEIGMPSAKLNEGGIVAAKAFCEGWESALANPHKIARGAE